MFLASTVVRDMRIGNQQLGILTISILQSTSSQKVGLRHQVAHTHLAITITTTIVIIIFTTLAQPSHYTANVQTDVLGHHLMGGADQSHTIDTGVGLHRSRFMRNTLPIHEVMLPSMLHNLYIYILLPSHKLIHGLAFLVQET